MTGSLETAGRAGEGFVPTRWTLVLRARGDAPEARAALAELCEAYYPPVLRFLLRDGRPEEVAQDLAQEFFAGILSRGEVGQADPARGRFRSYLLGAVKHFLADQRKHAHREKRGSGIAPESLDADAEPDSPRLEVADTKATMSDAWFDRQWALTVMDRALSAVRRELEAAGKGKHFEQLKPWLVGEIEALSQADAARQLGLTEGAVKVAIHRLRQRFRDALRTEIAQTVSEDADLDAELHYLVEVLTGS